MISAFLTNPHRFVVLSGLPGSGKTTLARRLAPAIGLPVIDKDDILEGMFDTRGTGDHAWRRELSRLSDRILREKAEASQGAILVSFWHLPGMSPDSGTPTEWLRSLSGTIVNLHCACTPEIAASRFLDRKRHPGHLDSEKSPEEVLTGIRRISESGTLGIRRIEVDTTGEPDLNHIANEILRL